MLTASQQADLTQQFIALKTKGQRQLVWLQGSNIWAGNLCKQLINCLSLANSAEAVTGLEVISQLPANKQQVEPLTYLPQIASNQARHFLGQEHLIVIFNAANGINPNALGALAGTLVAGGLLVLVTPADWPIAASLDYASLSSWPLSYQDLTFNFDQRLHRLITHYQPAVLNEQEDVHWKNFITAFAGKELANQTEIKKNQTLAAKETKLFYGALTPCQSNAVNQLLAWFKNNKPSPLVITANRGRGKSGALGLFLRELLINNLLATESKVLITAPNLAATHAIRQRLEGIPAKQLEQIQFIAPDALLAELPSASLLIIDEAAALPVPLLKAMVNNYPASLFATTQAGYEGNGRGFALRFKSYLTAHYPQLQQIELHQPLRWAANCPLEKLINKLLLLDTQLPDLALAVSLKNLQEEISFTWISQVDLAKNEQLLEQLMALLVLAHYRTSPNNLRQLLDAPKQQLLVAWLNNQPVGLALIQEEGGFSSELAEQIYLGKRRPQGHLLAQSLAFHAGFAQAAAAIYWRIQRVLVYPSLQRLGVGSLLLEEVEKAAREQENINFLGSSFGATSELANFWFNLNYLPVRLGLTANQASGEFTLQLIKPLQAEANTLAQQLRQRFTEVFIHNLGRNFNQLNSGLALNLLRECQLSWQPLSQADRQELLAFCQGARPLGLTLTAIKNWLLNNLHLTEVVCLELALQFSLQNKTPAALQKQLGLKGKKAVEEFFKQLLKNSYKV